MMRTSMTFALSVSLALMLAPLTAAPAVAQSPAPPGVVLPTDRTVLPIPNPNTRTSSYAPNNRRMT